MNPTADSIFQEEIYDFQAPTTVVLSEPWDQLQEPGRILLTKILQAVRLSLDAVRILHQAEFDLSGYTDKPRLLICFISPPKGVSRYEVHRAGGSAMVFADSLDALVQDEAGKRKLWAALKDLFPA